ncbi:MAG: hypothetical protein IPG93_21655 [Burkholderiales bacterium]|nr:hypothetical protein [Burkholderiales bacterium]
MLRSLFGDLAPPRESARRNTGETDAHGFASTAILEGEEGSGEQGQGADRHVRELPVSGSPANAIRAHFAGTQDDLADGERFVTLFDPAQMWAGAMIKALSDASGQPVGRLHLRDQYSLATMAVIERTTVPRRQDETLKIYHADVHAPGAEMVAISTALMERSDLVAVVVGPMHPAAIDAMIEMLSDACAGQTWRCPQVLFMLPVGALWIAQKIAATAWPASVQVHTLSEPLTSASAVWNKLLSHWGRVRPAGVATNDYGSLDALAPATGHTTYEAGRASQGTGVTSPILGVELVSASESQVVERQEAGRPNGALLDHSTGDTDGAFALQLPPAADPLSPATTQRAGRVPDTDKANRAMHDLLQLDGVIIAVLVDGNTGHVLASDGSTPDIERAAQAAAEIMRTHRRTLRMMGHWRPSDPVDEVLVTAGSRYHVMRALHNQPEHFVLAVLDKLRCNLATTRFRIMEAQQSLS